MEDYREAHKALKEAQWAADKEVVDCRQCTKPFSVSRRKVRDASLGISPPSVRGKKRPI